MRTYELVVILHPDLEIDADSAIAKVEQIITAAEGKIAKRDNWGKRRLAYTIKKHDFGVYIFFKVQLRPETVNGIENSLGITEEVIRHILVSEIPASDEKKPTTKKAAAVAEEE